MGQSTSDDQNNDDPLYKLDLNIPFRRAFRTTPIDALSVGLLKPAHYGGGALFVAFNRLFIR